MPLNYASPLSLKQHAQKIKLVRVFSFHQLKGRKEILKDVKRQKKHKEIEQ